jgi:hypothetical protein
MKQLIFRFLGGETGWAARSRQFKVGCIFHEQCGPAHRIVKASDVKSIWKVFLDPGVVVSGSVLDMLKLK